MDTQKTTSKSSLLKLMLLKAWRERWSDSQWGINIKTVLPRGVSGDVYNLADSILQQAIIGPDANKLVMSYLRHSLCAHLISFAAVLKRISKHDNFEKVHCISALLDFLDIIMTGVTCRSKQEEGMLGNALLSLVNWLSQSFLYILEENRTQGVIDYEQTEMVEKTIVVLEKIIQNQFLMGVIYVAKYEDRELFTKINKNYLEIKNIILNTGYVPTNGKHFEDLLHKIAYVDVNQLQQQQQPQQQHLLQQSGQSTDIDTYVEPVTYCLQPLLAVEVLLNPNNDTQTLVTQLQMIQRIKNYSASRLYCEIIRACLISLYNVSGTARESIWCAFTFIKVPHILKSLNSISKDFDEKFDYAADVVAAFEMLCEDPILDFMDTKCACNTIEFLLNELAKQHLVNEKHIKHFSSKRDAITTALSKIDLNNQQPSIIKFVIRAEPPLTGILKALSADYNKMQEPLLGMLCQVLTGNSLELILSVATVEGKLKTFVQRLINCNESSKQVAGEIGKPAIVRASLFDVSFLMLAFIVQAYGSDVVLDERGNSFFEKWVRDNMIEKNKFKSPTNMIHMCDPSKVDELLVHLYSSDGSGLKNCSLKWQDICVNLPGALYQVLMAWENETISAAEVKNNLDSIKTRLCAYSVCAASWLCSYMQVVREDELLKPMNMVQQFLTTLTAEELSQQENFKERIVLACQIIRKLQHDIHPAPNQKIRALMLTQNLVSQQPLEQQFNDVWKTVSVRGWLPIESTQILESLLTSCGPMWLIPKLVNEIMQCKYTKDMLKTMDIVFALMHLDIENCTIVLLSDWLPMLLLNQLQKTDITEPQSSILARLCVYCILSTLELPLSNNCNSRKRPNSGSSAGVETATVTATTVSSGGAATATTTTTTSASADDSLDNLAPLIKARKLNTENGNGTDLTTSEFIFDSGIVNRDIPIMMREKIQSSLQNLFKMFCQFLTVDDLSPKVYFIFQFLSLLVQCGKDRIKPVLNLIPAGLVQNLLKIVETDEITYGFLLKVHDLTSSSGRQAAMSDLCMLRNIQLRKGGINL